MYLLKVLFEINLWLNLSKYLKIGTHYKTRNENNK